MRKRVMSNRDLRALRQLVEWAREQDLPRFEVPYAVNILSAFLGEPESEYLPTDERRMLFLPGDEGLIAELRVFADQNGVEWLAAMPMDDVVDCYCRELDNGCENCGFTGVIPREQADKRPALAMRPDAQKESER